LFLSGHIYNKFCIIEKTFYKKQKMSNFVNVFNIDKECALITQVIQLNKI